MKTIKRRTFSAEFKLEAASLVTEQDYSVKQASEAMNNQVNQHRMHTLSVSTEPCGMNGWIWMRLTALLMHKTWLQNGYGLTITKGHIQPLEAYVQ